MARPKFPIGTHVTVHPEGCIEPSYWAGRVVAIESLEAGLVNVECTDPRGFLNNHVGHVTTFDTRYLRLVEQPAAAAPVQLAIDTA